MNEDTKSNTISSVTGEKGVKFGEKEGSCGDKEGRRKVGTTQNRILTEHSLKNLSIRWLRLGDISEVKS